MNNLHITDITRTKRGRFSIFIDSEFAGVLHSDIYFSSKIAIGDKLSVNSLNDLLYRSQIIIAKERALTLLSARSYTSKKLKDKLLRDVDEPAADEIIVRMEELGLIDDKDYALRYSMDCINLRGFSHKRVVEALYQQGLTRQVIEDTLLALPQEDQVLLIYKQISKKYLSKIALEDDKRRTINALLRRGFSYNYIKLVIDNLNEDINYYINYWEE